MIDFSERLNELMIEADIEPKELARILELKNSTVIYKWKNGTLGLLLDTAIKMADYFKCSIDFLIGRSNDTTVVLVKQCPTFGVRLKVVLKEKGVSQYKIINCAKVSVSSLVKWFHNQSTPHISSVLKIADYLDVTIDYLVGRE